MSGWLSTLTGSPPALPAPAGSPGQVPGTWNYGDPGLGGDTLPPGATTLPPYLPGSQPIPPGTTLPPAAVPVPSVPVSADLWRELLALAFLVLVALMLPAPWSKWFVGVILLGSVLKSAPLWANALTHLNAWAGSL